jgi:hypothetical protein
VFGVFYNTEDWTWSIPDAKLQNIVAAIQEAVESKVLSDKQVRSLMGKLINVKPLVPGGRFHVDHLMAALADSQKQKKVSLLLLCKEQLKFWSLMLRSCNKRLSIPSLGGLPPWAIDVFTDAAGGTLEALGRGVGGVMAADWFYYPWSKKINSGHHRVGGKKMSRKLAALEMTGALVALASGAALLRGRPVNFWIDNAGSVGAWRKGYSASCPICTTVAKAVSYIAAALGSQVDIKKVRRCSDVGPVLADHLSKAKFSEFRRAAADNGWAVATQPLSIPPPLLSWLHEPNVDHDLGPRIVFYLARHGLDILGHH